MTRILTLLLVTQVAAEWVEITQQHYRKPYRTHSLFTTPEKVMDVEDTTKPWTYNNRSVTEHNWNRNPARPANIGNVKRVQHTGSTVKTTETVKLDDDDIGLDVDIIDYELRPNYGPTRPTIDLHDHSKQKGTIEKVPNLGNVKRVQLNNSPVKSPVVNFKGDREKYSINRHEHRQHDDHRTEGNDFVLKKNTETFNRRIYVNHVKKHHGTDGTAAFPLDEDEVTSLNTKIPKPKYEQHTTTKPNFITATKGFSNYETQQNRFYKITNSTFSEVTEKTYVFTTEIIDTGEEIATKTNTKPTEKVPKNNILNIVNDSDADSHENNVHFPGNNERQENLMVNDYKTKTKGNNAQSIQKHQHKNEFEKENSKEMKGKKDETRTNTKTEKNKVNTLENVMKFMRVVADTISRNSRRSFGGKMQYLHELKDSILANIEQRIDATWPDDDSAGARRRSRSAHASSRGHVHFPSSESALMTISFLTFAVFLIKLVLQVIHTYKHKAMMVAPLMVASGRNVFKHGHH